MFCPKCGNEIAEGSAFCGKCGAPVGAQAGGSAPVGGAQGAASGSAGAGAPTPKRNGAKIGAIAAVVVVVVVLVAGFATNWFGLAGVQSKEAVEVPAASQGADEAQGANAADGQSADANESAGDAQGGSQAAASVTVKSAVEAYTWDELSQISAEIGAAGDEAAAIEVAKKYNLCTPEGKLDGTQVKSVTLADGTQTTVQIVGFAHDDKTSGGKAGITFVFGGPLVNQPLPMNDDDSIGAEGGWESCSMRRYLNGDGLLMLPEELKTIVVPVDKLTDNKGHEGDSEVAVSSVSTTSDYLWLFSNVELSGVVPEWSENEAANEVFDAEGSEYKLFRDMGVSYLEANAILERSFEGEQIWWWMRSPNPYNSGYFSFVSAEGAPHDATYAGADLGVIPGFCI